ncbi:DNA repair protein RAD16, partial [Tremellales sp. Uapishka_1]
MPPRRAARTSLPTPTASSKGTGSNSVASTPDESSSKTRSRGVVGIETPASLTDGEEAEMSDEESSGRKRKMSSEADTPFSLSPQPLSSGSKKRYVLESITLPTRRSKLGTDKTESLDNMTLKGEALGSPVGRSGSAVDLVPERDELDSDDLDDVKPRPPPAKKAATKRASAAHQPFNIGTHSSVAKSTLADLALTPADAAALSSDDELLITRKTKATKPRAKAEPKRKSKGKGKSSAVVSDADVKVEDEYAEDSEDEAEQLKKAMKASKATTGKGKAKVGITKTKSAGQAVGGRVKKETGNKTALRNAAAKAAESEFCRANGVKPEPRDDTPLSFPSAGESDFEASDASLSDSEMDSDPSVVGSIPRRRKRFSGKGRTLNGAEIDSEDDPLDLIDHDALDDQHMSDLAKLKAEKREAARLAKEEAIPRRKKEQELKKKLKRNLTQGEKNLIALSEFHPELENVWGDLKANIVPVKPVPMEAHPSLKLTLLPFQKESLFWMKKQEEGQWKGGMLADEMGMGKTIQTIALLLSEPRRKPSLVVAPVVALMQWKHEIETHAEGFSVTLWHGQGRMKAEQLKKFDVVLVSYGTLEASFRRQQLGFKRNNLLIKEKSPMHSFEWHRVILDEAHNIKERATNAAKAAFALQAKYKWCLSGTPLQNRVGELYSLVRFLGADPFSYYFCKRCDCKSLHWQFKDRRHCDTCGCSPMQHVCLWNTEILTPIAKYGIVAGGPGQTAFKKLKILLDRMMLRRTKLERADDLGLPPRTIVVRRDFFSPQEKELYMSLFTNAKRQFDTYLDSGTVLNNYSNIFSLITRMRQMACHPDLVLRGKTSSYVKDVNEEVVCRLCNDTAEDAIVSACKHVFDRECIRQYLEVQQSRGHPPKCPVCHIEISIDLEAEAIDIDEGPKKARQGILSRLDLNNWRSSSKLEALVEELEKLRNQDCTIKSLVFSQFVSFLDLIAFRLQRAGFVICRLEGGMTPQQRDATIQHFMNNTHVTVFLISLKAGGVALNLTEASRVFMMDSWWNPSVEYQAMDRIHRLGQKRPVTVVKLVIEDSIEDQIVQLQHKKLAMTEAALSTDPDAALGKLTVEDLGFLFKL